jgi:FixJ family two-component response regulator
VGVYGSKIFIVDDDADVRASLARFFASVGYATEAYGCADEFLCAYSDEEPACLVLDVRTPGVSGLAVQERVRAEGAWLPILVLSSHAEVPVAVRAMKTGAVDFILKPFTDHDLLERTRVALAIAKNTFEEDRERGRFERCLRRLTPREREILHHMLEGKANKVIADDLRISQKTVEVHRYHLMHKMGTSSSVQLAQLAGRFWRSLQSNGTAERLYRAA